MSRARPWLLFIVSVMELSWLYPWLALVGYFLTRYEHVLSVGPAFALFFLALVVVEALSRWRIATRYQRFMVGGLILFTTLLLIRIQVYPGAPFFSLRWLGTSLGNVLRLEQGISRELFLLLATYVLWWRGMSMSQQLLIADVVGFRFRLGVVFLIGLAVLQAITFRQDVIGWVLCLFMCGLLSVALTRIREGVPVSQANRRFGPRWLVLLVVGAGATLLLGLLVSAVLSTENLLTIWGWIQPVVLTLVTLYFYFLSLVGYAIVWLVDAFLQFIAPGEPLTLPTLFESPLFPGLDSRQPEHQEIPAWGAALCQAGMGLLLLGLLALLLLIVRRLRPGASEGPDTWRESVWSASELRRGLLNGMRGSLRQLASLWSGRESRRAYSLATVRHIYASLLALAQERGAPRPLAQTPFEYLPRLQRTFPDWPAELQTLTSAYVAAHYGRLPDSEAELQALRDAWQRIYSWAEANKTVNN